VMRSTSFKVKSTNYEWGIKKEKVKKKRIE
jgi:hypothetical protein